MARSRTGYEPGGRRFESCRAHQYIRVTAMWPLPFVLQMVICPTNIDLDSLWFTSVNPLSRANVGVLKQGARLVQTLRIAAYFGS